MEAREAATRSFVERRDHNHFSETKLKQKDSSWLQPVYGQHGEIQDLVNPPRHVSTKKLGFTFFHEYNKKISSSLLALSVAPPEICLPT